MITYATTPIHNKHQIPNMHTHILISSSSNLTSTAIPTSNFLTEMATSADPSALEDSACIIKKVREAIAVASVDAQQRQCLLPVMK